MVRIVGDIQARARIKGIVGPRAIAEVGQALFVAADEIKVDAQHSIIEGSISGKGHIVSLPGEPPNADTHDLDRQIESELVAPLKAIVSSNSRHAAPLEFGTSKMEARPSMGPAAERGRQRTTQLVTAAVNRINKRTG